MRLLVVSASMGAGHDGGRVVFEGTPADLVAARSTVTGEHLAAYIRPAKSAKFAKSVSSASSASSGSRTA